MKKSKYSGGEIRFSHILYNFAMIMANEKTDLEFKSVMQECRSLFEKKLHDYGASWRILRLRRH